MTSTLVRQTEFVTITTGPLKGKRVTGACAPNSGGGAARRAAQNDAYTTQYMVAQMYAWGLCDDNGVTNAGKLNTALQKLGFSTLYSGTTDPFWVGWESWVKTHIGQTGDPGVMEFSLGQKLVDVISGLSENAKNLQYHFIALLEYHPGGMSARAGKPLLEGYWCADGDNFAAGNVLQFYPITTLAAARPIAAIAVARKASYPLLDSSDAPSAPPTGGSMSIDLSNAEVARYFEASGSDWKCKSNGFVIKAGPMLDYYRAIQSGPYNGLTWPGLPVANVTPLSGHAGVTFQPFERGALADDPAHAYDAPPGMTGPVYAMHIESGAGLAYYTVTATAPLVAQVNTLTSDKASLTQQLNAALKKLTDIGAAVKSLQSLIG